MNNDIVSKPTEPKPQTFLKIAKTSKATIAVVVPPKASEKPRKKKLPLFWIDLVTY